MSKRLVEQSRKLSIFWLKKHGYLDRDYSRNSGGITWTFGEIKNSISFSVIRDNWGEPEEKTFIELIYAYTNEKGVKENMNYSIKLATTPCNYGGVRYWFICPLVKKGEYCGRRVGTVFNTGKYFGCRHCAELTYDCQMQSERYKGFVSIPDLDKAEAKIKRYYYNGKPTRKYKNLLRMEDKFNISFLRGALPMLKKEYPDLLKIANEL